jgi:hypothetical protein
MRRLPHGHRGISRFNFRPLMVTKLHVIIIKNCDRLYLVYLGGILSF